MGQFHNRSTKILALYTHFYKHTFVYTLLYTRFYINVLDFLLFEVALIKEMSFLFIPTFKFIRETKSRQINFFYRIVWLFTLVFTSTVCYVSGSRSPCYQNGSCTDICQVRNNTAQCSCYPNRTLVDGYRCVSNDVNKKCMNKTKLFICSDGLHCIDMRYACDGDFDCTDKSDEDTKVCCTYNRSVN